MAPSVKGLTFMEVEVQGNKQVLTYFSKKMVDQVARYGDGILRIPEECVTLRGYQKRILHLGRFFCSRQGLVFLGTVDEMPGCSHHL